MASLVLEQMTKIDDIYLDSGIKYIMLNLVFFNYHLILFDILMWKSLDMMII